MNETIYKGVKIPIFEELVCNNGIMYGLQTNAVKDSYFIWRLNGEKSRIITHVKTDKGTILTMKLNKKGELKVQIKENQNFS